MHVCVSLFLRPAVNHSSSTNLIQMSGKSAPDLRSDLLCGNTSNVFLGLLLHDACSSTAWGVQTSQVPGQNRDMDCNIQTTNLDEGKKKAHVQTCLCGDWARKVGKRGKCAWGQVTFKKGGGSNEERDMLDMRFTTILISLSPQQLLLHKVCWRLQTWIPFSTYVL